MSCALTLPAPKSQRWIYHATSLSCCSPWEGSRPQKQTGVAVIFLKHELPPVLAAWTSQVLLYLQTK